MLKPSGKPAVKVLSPSEAKPIRPFARLLWQNPTQAVIGRIQIETDTDVGCRPVAVRVCTAIPKRFIRHLEYQQLLRQHQRERWKQRTTHHLLPTVSAASLQSQGRTEP